MKKLIALLACVLVACLFCAANAETKTFVFSGTCDLEGNAVEDGIPAFEGVSVTIDDEAMTIAIERDGSEEKGAIEIQEVKGGYAIYALMESGEDAVYAYSVSDDGAETLTLYDTDAQLCILFTLD